MFSLKCTAKCSKKKDYAKRCKIKISWEEEMGEFS